MRLAKARRHKGPKMEGSGDQTLLPHEATSPVFTHASRALYAVAVVDVVHIGAVIWQAPSEKLTAVNVVSSSLLNAGMLALLIWLGRGVRRGRRLPGAAATLCFLWTGLVITLAVGLRAGYEGARLVFVVQLLFVTVLVAATVLVCRALFHAARLKDRH